MSPDVIAEAKDVTVTALQRNPVTVTPDADITMQGAPLRIFKIFKAEESSHFFCTLVSLPAFQEITNLPLLAVQVVGSLIGNDFTRVMAGMGATTALRAADGFPSARSALEGGGGGAVHQR